MKPIEFTQQMKILSVSYGKDLDEETVEVWYEYFKSIEKEVFKRALKKIITTSKYMPSISEILEECEKTDKEIKLNVLDQMKERGYFKDVSEYEKTIMWLEKGIVPKWLLEDMRKEYKLLASEKKLLEIEGK